MCIVASCNRALQDLSLAGNQLTELPDNIGNLRSLKRLQLSGNYLEKLPDSLCNLQSLQVSEHVTNIQDCQAVGGQFLRP